MEVQLAPPVDRDVGEDGGRHQAHQLGPVDLGPTGHGVVHCGRTDVEGIDEVAGDLGVAPDLEPERPDSGRAQLGGE
ncbi:MAG: hypothetical protein E6G01_13660 [Actinobacteria bacterium]|nr:MAG: hypothetical protein E6G01_13660 [Actinomycetota bacterium]